MSARRGPKFYPPGDSALAFRLVGLVFRLGQRHWAGIRQIELAPADLARLQALDGQPALICPNHPTLSEPIAVLLGVLRAGLTPNFVMDRTTLRMTSILRPVLLASGAYSLRRGTVDRDSFACTRRLLVAGKRIVMFPEGETYGINDKLLPFHDGVVQMAFWGSQDRVKAGLDPNVLLQPMAVKYYYDRDMSRTIDAALTRLEQRLALAADAGLTRYERLRRVGFAFVTSMERANGLESDEDGSLDERIERWFARALERVSAALQVEHVPGSSLQDRLRRLFTTVESQIEGDDEPTPYDRELHSEHEPAWRAFEKDLSRLQCFQTVRDGYVAAHPSAERYLDVLGRLELEVCRRDRHYAARRAVIRVGEPIRLSDWTDAYREDRRAAVPALTAELRGRVQVMVDELGAQAPLLGI